MFIIIIWGGGAVIAFGIVGSVSGLAAELYLDFQNVLFSFVKIERNLEL